MITERSEVLAATQNMFSVFAGHFLARARLVTEESFRVPHKFNCFAAVAHVLGMTGDVRPLTINEELRMIQAIDGLTSKTRPFPKSKSVVVFSQETGDLYSDLQRMHVGILPNDYDLIWSKLGTGHVELATVDELKDLYEVDTVSYFPTGILAESLR